MRNLIGKVALIIGSLTLLFGCKGPAGSNGAQGAQGVPGLPNTTSYTGSVTTNAYLVSIPGLNVADGDILSVYACNSGGLDCEQLNVYQPGIPANMAYLEVPGGVTLDNLLTVGLPQYVIDVTTRH
jgi:hypothetical protein